MRRTEGGRRRLCLGAGAGKLVGLAGVLLLLLCVVVGLVVYFRPRKGDSTHAPSSGEAGLAPSPPPLIGPETNGGAAVAGVGSGSSSSSSDGDTITNDKQAAQEVVQEAAEDAVDQVVETLDPGKEGGREGGWVEKGYACMNRE